MVSEVKELFEQGFQGLKLCGGHLMGKIDLNDEAFFPIWEIMENDGHVLAVDFSEGELQVGHFDVIM